MRRVARFLLVLFWVSALAESAGLREAAARCVNVTTGVVVTATTGQPNSNESVVCDTTAPNPPPASTVVSAAAGSSNVSVTVQAGSILSSTARAIGVVNNSTVLNQGQVSTSGLNAFGISTTGNGSTLTNQGTITTTGSRGFGLDARGSNSTLNNSGTINVSGPNSAGIRSTETTATTLITNSGTITVTGSGASPDFAAGVLFQAGAAGTFVNQAGGTVSSSTDSGVRGADANITVRNAGTITGGNGIAINLGNGNDIIQVTGGQINGAIITGTGNDQLTMSGGTVAGNVNLGNGNNAIIMTGGQINGNVILGTGNDSVQLFTGATITGSIDGGGGTNTFTLDGTGTALLSGTISNFQTLTKQNTGTWEVTSPIAGVTAVAVTGGKLILSATNTYTGGTTISAGTLQLGNGGTSGSIVGNVTDNGTLAFNRSDIVTFPGLISGTGTLNQIGAGTTVLTADNTYTGGTTISAGTLQLGNGGTSGSVVGDIVNNAALVIDHSNTVTLPGTISGVGSLSQIGAGTTVLTADNTYTGGTTISAGTLQLGNGGTSGSVVGDIVNNAALVIDHSNTVTLPGTISGVGSLSQIGAGTTILTADNTYTGGTTISAGTLQLGNGGTSGSVVGDIVNNAALVIDHSNTVTLPGTISGVGSLSQIGAGTTVLTADNTYTGGTTISAGTLQLGNGGTSGSVVGDIVNNAALVIDHSNTVTLPGTISGAGSLSQIGTGTTILTADNTYTGGTTISAGTLQLGNGGTSGSVVGDIVNNAALVIDHSNTVTLPGTISGVGSLSQIGAGTTILTADNTYTGGTTISAGTLQLGNGGTSGSVVGDIVNNAALVIDHSNTVTLPGTISGAGSLSQIGAGTTILTADNTYTGGTTISAGTLQLGNGGTSGSVVGDIVNNAALVIDHSNTVTLPGTISGVGSLSQIGAGTTILTADNTYTGGTTISAGTLAARQRGRERINRRQRR